jgi:uncharacterized RDD family membrane protein YckC
MTHVSGRRYLAHLVDGVVLLAILGVLLVPAAIVSGVLIVVVLVLWITVGQVAYFVVTQLRHGRSPGKRVAGLRVVDKFGAPPTTAALVRRSLPLVVEYIYVIAFLAIMSSPYRQRLSDRWAKTYVIAD